MSLATQPSISIEKPFEKNINETFDPDERQIRALLKQNLKHFDVDGSIDFDKLTFELSKTDRSQSGVLSRQQIEEVVYKVRLPLQRSIIFQILERHCKAYPTLYRYMYEQHGWLHALHFVLFNFIIDMTFRFYSI
jgi:hypothetical protein